MNKIWLPIAEYAKITGKSVPRIYQMKKEGKIKIRKGFYNQIIKRKRDEVLYEEINKK